MTERVGLLGWPVTHSISPAMHNAAFAALGLDWEYNLLPVPPADLHDAITRFMHEGYRGFNVTIPHKQAVLSHPLITNLSGAVKEIGAANTLTVQPDGTLAAHNTDALGFLADLLPHLDFPVDDMRCLVLGTGGSAKAVISGLRRLNPAAIYVVSRQPDGSDHMISYDQLSDLAFQSRIIVNCTPLGMWPLVERTPWPDDLAFPSNVLLYDLVYNPPVTRLMQQAQASGARAVGGLGMLVRQAGLAFETWTGFDPDLDTMFAAARDALAKW